MANIGNIVVPTVSPSGTFPVVSSFGYKMARDHRIAVHTFMSGNRKIEQRFLIGTGARLFTVTMPTSSMTGVYALRDFWEARSGPYQPFTYNHPEADGTTTEYTVRFASEPLSWQMLAPMMAATGCTLMEIPSTVPTYSVTATVSRFPSGTLSTALLAQAQEVIPLLKIQSKESGYPAIYLADRNVIIGSQLHQARLLSWDGIQQSLGSAADDARFTLGNADAVFTLLTADTNLDRARVEFSLFHVGTGIKLDLWAGELTTWEDPGDSPEFRITASDGIYELTLPYPLRTCSRTCWKDFADGKGCTWTSGLDTTNFPSASGASCDKGLDTPNGCLAHQNGQQFGGINIDTQAVTIKDNSTGKFGINRLTLTSTSIVNDTVYGNVLPEVYTNTDIPVNALMAMGRDESDFYEALGIVGEGPIGFGLGHKLDGQFHHGYPGPLGLRQIAGNDPAGSTDFFSLDQSGNQVGGNFRKVYSGSSTYLNTHAAGTAFVVIRRSDAKGLQLSRATEHSMQVIVASGRQGWVWSGAGSRVIQTLTNPIWIVVNIMLRARGLQFSSASTCEQYFDVDSAIAAAAICDTTVTSLIGGGSETQFVFKGTITEQKPLRDWVDEVLANCLGYYVFANGKMKFGCRVNASAAEAFTSGNVIVNSVNITPVKPAFNDLTAMFADEAWQFQQNSVNVYAVDHQKLIGGAVPLATKSTLNLLGTSRASQAARIIQTRLKEELGGATAAEWRAARNATLKTTVLALATEPGMVASLTNEKMPSGSGKFRIQGWRLNSDYSIDIQGRTVTDDMYDQTAGPKPADVVPGPVPVELIQYPLHPAWQPAVQRGRSGETVQGLQMFSIFVQEDYATRADGSVQAQIIVNGMFPRNRYLACPAPVIRSLSSVGTGGGLTNSKPYFVQVSAYQGEKTSPPSNVLAVIAPGGGSLAAQITIGSIEWPVCPSGSWDGYKLMLGWSEGSMCEHSVSGSLTSSVTFAGPQRFFGGASQPNVDKIRAKVKTCPYPGVMRARISSLSGFTVTCDELATGGDDFSLRNVAIISDDSDGSPGPGWFFLCFSYDQSTGTFTLTEDASALGVDVGDMLVVLTAPSGGSNTATDSKWSFTTDALIGKLARVMYGTGRGQLRTIASNTTTQITVEPAWTTVPDGTSVIVVEDANWAYSAESGALTNESGKQVDIAVPIDNLGGAVLLVGGFAVDRFGVEATEEDSPTRLLFMKGQPFQVEVDTSTYTADANTRTLLVKAGGSRTITLPDAAANKGNRIFIKRQSGGSTISVQADAIDGGSSVTVGDSVILESDGEKYNSFTGSGSGGATIATEDFTLASGPGTTTITTTTAPAQGLAITLFITQNATGGREIAYSAQFAASCPTEIYMGANEETVRMFVGGSDNLWHHVTTSA